MTENPFLYEHDGIWGFGKGKHAGESLEDVACDDPKYLEWLLEQEWVGDDWKEAIEDVM